MWIVLLLGACSIAATPPVHPRPTSQLPLLPVSYWQQKFDADLNANAAQTARLSRSADSWDFYSLAYSIDALSSMFEATGERAYLDQALSYVDNMIMTARPSQALPTSDFKDQYLGWVSNQNGQTGQEVALYESYSWRYVARLLRVMRSSGLADEPAYRGRYAEVLAFTEENIFAKWYARGVDDYIFRNRTHMAAQWASIALDLSVVTGDEVRRNTYLEVVNAVDRDLPNYSSSLRQQLRPNESEPEAYVWSDVWGETGGSAQDVSHGNAVISYVVEARDIGSGEWTAADMARFTRTLTAFVVGANGRYPEYVDGRGSGNGWIADGFVKLGRYDPTVQAMLQEYGVQNMQYYAAMAANARFLDDPSRPDG